MIIGSASDLTKILAKEILSEPNKIWMLSRALATPFKSELAMLEKRLFNCSVNKSVSS